MELSDDLCRKLSKYGIKWKLSEEISDKKRIMKK